MRFKRYLCFEKCHLFRTFKIFSSSLNDVLLVILNIIFDIILLWNFHRYLDKKSIYIVNLDHHSNILKSKKNINRMIFFSSILCIISRLPEFLTNILLIIYSKNISKLCNYNFSCELISEEAEFFSLISISCQFYIFLIFDLKT